MRRQNTEGFRPRCVRWFRAIGLTLGGILLVAASSHAGVLNASWTAPTTNTDGSALTDLALYRIYYSISASPCPGSTFFQAATPTSVPPPSQTVSFQLTGLTTGSIYSVAVTAVNTYGNESACSAVASAVARGDSSVTPTDTDPHAGTVAPTDTVTLTDTVPHADTVTPTDTDAHAGTVTSTGTVTPTGTVSFGTVTIGSSATQTFTVQSTGSGTITGTASVPAPFRIDSGSPFTLVGTGATATVTVRFTPTSTGVASTSVSFTVNGDTQSRLVTGSGTH
jgi:HYDIN/CFA65/VesB-like, Ig-like domain/Fibronectin type III domain